MSTTPIRVNGAGFDVTAEPETPLLWVLRGELKLIGTKFGCGRALCGACTVHLDGEPARSCVTPLSAIGQREITTIEGVARRHARVAQAVQEAWVELDVVQCGYCQSGQVMAAIGLLARTPAPDDAAIDAAMSGILCRCGTYPRIRAALHRAARRLAGG
jgi:isoquinoline 1-oxidoreductase alpha subunit